MKRPLSGGSLNNHSSLTRIYLHRTKIFTHDLNRFKKIESLYLGRESAYETRMNITAIHLCRSRREAFDCSNHDWNRIRDSTILDLANDIVLILRYCCNSKFLSFEAISLGLFFWIFVKAINIVPLQIPVIPPFFVLLICYGRIP